MFRTTNDYLTEVAADVLNELGLAQEEDAMVKVRNFLWEVWDEAHERGWGDGYDEGRDDAQDVEWD